ncbi:MAG: preprotein translocase subunit SecA [Candidatus Paraimprobicoccus trichonymphae]|uniref:Protein translocase subunit SecA n=1 Tax=Candidatus Paraimprobicoccus trichonymphae TaxID=3033793 RepID=A0AA48I2N4_9FIRM|nr:MAG: preprotein translocase subunit SecA [Candidatus Paraimprobicoccus trichonymphae]
MNFLKFLLGNYSKRELKRIKPICNSVLSLEEKYKNMNDEELKYQTIKLKERLNSGETLNNILPDAFAVCREASWRVLSMKHFPVQIIGGIVLHQGRISEMKTGEGKTLVATLPAYLNALSGKPVHIVTVNDYLAKRDSEIMGKLYRFLGLTIGVVKHDMGKEERREAYDCDITYATNNELGFDYLKDNMVPNKESRVQRGHSFAIVDEVDSILIDEARTPLIISGEGDKSTELYGIADNFVRTLKSMSVIEINAKEDTDEKFKDGDYVIDEKSKTANLSPSGIEKAEKYFGLENLTDPENNTIQHHINQALKAHGVMKRDSDYVVKDGEVLIVDEFTGRLMQGRRYNDGLHQAIEAKEKVKIERESKTLASITFQNYFRLYDKLSGMTGTAMTEEPEFREIYKLDVVEIPPNKPVIREDMPDLVYKSEESKFKAIVEEIIEAHKTGQPMLVGTISIEKSEFLSYLLKAKNVSHKVLNAKYHQKEAEIIAQAGKKGSITIATNMAGRGTDITLGGNAEYMAKSELRELRYKDELIADCDSHSETKDEDILKIRRKYMELYNKHKNSIKKDSEEVKKVGGLYIIGTERHESRRIDNQLRGRSGRQGDPGKSKFFLSLDDDLMRLFGGERLKNMMSRLNIEEDVPLEARMLTKSIESAQKKIEGRNFSIRKNVLQFDDVLNRQREIIYSQRNKILDGEDLKNQISAMMSQSVNTIVSRYVQRNAPKDTWNLEGLRDYYLNWLLNENHLKYSPEDLESVTFESISEFIVQKCSELYIKQEEMIGYAAARELERMVVLKTVDEHWMNHIDAMEELKRGINLRGYAQRDPVVDYRMEGFEMFDEMVDTMKENVVKFLLSFRASIFAHGIFGNRGQFNNQNSEGKSTIGG